MARKVTLYTNNGELSTLARIYLEKNDILFEEINVAEERNKQIVMDTKRIPLLIVKVSHGVHTVSGFDEFRYASALNPRLSYDGLVRIKDEKQDNVL